MTAPMTYGEAVTKVLTAMGWITPGQHCEVPGFLDDNFMFEYVIPWLAAKGWIGNIEWDARGFGAVIFPGIGEPAAGLAEAPTFHEAVFMAAAEALGD